MRIGFDCGALNERGTSVAVYDYAHYGRKLLGFEPVILFDASLPAPAPVYERFRRHFKLLPYEGLSGFQRETGAHKIDVLYSIKGGQRDGKLSASSKNVIHCVFQNFDPHGEVYAYISEWLADQMTGGLYPSVPHIVSLPDPDSDLRAKLGIPQHALVLGRHGGYNEFNLKFAQKAVVEAAGRRRDLYFIFLNTAQFCEHERVVFLPPVTDPVEKANFIQACDAMLHARARGETFGLAMAEFMFCGKPVLCWMGGTDRHHLRLLPDRTTAYKTYSDLLRILTGLEKTGPQASWQRMVARFSPVNVMNQFKSVFIDSPPQDLSVRPSLGTIFKTSLTQKALKVRYDLWREGIGL